MLYRRQGKLLKVRGPGQRESRMESGIRNEAELGVVGVVEVVVEVVAALP